LLREMQVNFYCKINAVKSGVNSGANPTAAARDAGEQRRHGGGLALAADRPAAPWLGVQHLNLRRGKQRMPRAEASEEGGGRREEGVREFVFCSFFGISCVGKEHLISTNSLRRGGDTEHYDVVRGVGGA
jgi:hypothetical protein